MKKIIVKIKNGIAMIPQVLGLLASSVKSYKLIFLLLAVVLSVALAFGLKRDGIVYNGNTRFILQEKSGGSMGGVGGLLGSFGFGGEEKENFERLLAFAKTQRIQQDILLTLYAEGSDTTTIGDAIVKAYELEGELESLSLIDFKFGDHSKENPSVEFKKASARIGKVITGGEGVDGILNLAYDRKTYIINISASANSENLTIGLLNATYEALERFYSQDISTGQAKDLNLLRHKKDSIERDIVGRETALAKLKDKTQGLVLNQDRTKEGRLFMQIQMSYELLGELTKNEALAEYSVRTSDKGFLLLDEPIKPLISGSRSFVKVLVASIAMGIFGALLLVFIFNIFSHPDLLDRFNNES